MAYYEKPDEVKALREKIKLDPDGAYLFWGEEEYLKHHYLGELRRIISDEGMEELNRTVLDFRYEDTMNDLEESVSSLPVMASHKIIEVWGMDILGLKKEGETRLIKALNAMEEGTILVIFERLDELDLNVKKNRERKIVRELRENATVVEFPRQSEQKLLSWVDKIFRTAEVRISDVNIGNMIRLCDYSMTRLKNDSEKLIAYCKHNGLDCVPNEIIGQLVKPTAENEVWDLTNAIASRSLKEAMAILENLRLQNVEPVIIVYMIAKTVSALALIRSAGGKMSDDEISKTAELFGGWQVKKYRDSMGRWSDSALSRAIQLTFECENDLKSAKMPPYVSVESLLTAILGS